MDKYSCKDCKKYSCKDCRNSENSVNKIQTLKNILDKKYIKKYLDEAIEISD